MLMHFDYDHNNKYSIKDTLLKLPDIEKFEREVVRKNYYST